MGWNQHGCRLLCHPHPKDQAPTEGTQAQTEVIPTEHPHPKEQAPTEGTQDQTEVQVGSRYGCVDTAKRSNDDVSSRHTAKERHGRTGLA